MPVILSANLLPIKSPVVSATFWAASSEAGKNSRRLKFMKEKQWVKTISKYTAAFDYFDKILLALSATTGGVSISWFFTIIDAPVVILSASLSLRLYISNGIAKNLLKTNWN